MYNIWVDLDKTIWSCYDLTGNEIWAKELLPPYDVCFTNTKIMFVEGSNGRCYLHEGVEQWLLKKHRSSLVNFISAGGIRYTSFEQQPSVNFLKMFDILKFFTFRVIEYKDFDKADYLRKLNNKEIVLIDDDDKHLNNASKFGIPIIDRKAFSTWNDCPI